MVHRGPSNLEGQAFVNSGLLAVQLAQQSGQVPEPLRPGGVLQGLVLRQDVDKPFAEVVAVAPEQLASPLPKGGDDLPDLGLGTEAVRHAAREPGAARVAREAREAEVARPSSGRRGDHATAPA